GLRAAPQDPAGRARRVGRFGRGGRGRPGRGRRVPAGARGVADRRGVRAHRRARPEQGVRRVSTGVTVRVPAKVNVQLAAGAARCHDLANGSLAVGLYDEVTAAPSPGGPRVTCAGADAGQVPLDGTNLAARAAVALAERYGRPADVHLHIAKDIPVAGGMA